MDYLKKWLVIDRNRLIVSDTNDLNLAWLICECASRCGQSLTVTSISDYKSGNY